MPHNLEGRLETARILEKYSDTSAFGKLPNHGNREIFVTHGEDSVGKDVLVKVDYRFFNTPTGHMVAASIPKGFKAKAHGEYVLTGLWSEDMLDGELPSTLSEVNQYYDPGAMGKTLLITELDDYIDGMMISAKIQYPVISAVENLPRLIGNSPRNTKSFLYTANVDHHPIEFYLKELGLEPVAMDSLR